MPWNAEGLRQAANLASQHPLYVLLYHVIIQKGDHFSNAFAARQFFFDNGTQCVLLQKRQQRRNIFAAQYLGKRYFAQFFFRRKGQQLFDGAPAGRPVCLRLLRS